MSAPAAGGPAAGGVVHVVGAGLAGLSAATLLASEGRRVVLSDAARQAGGRCRSYHDPQLDLVIDNGNHLVLSGNVAVNGYLARIGATDRLTGPDEAAFSFADLRDGARWTVRPNPGPVPWWVLSKTRRTPGTTAADHLALAPLLRRHPAKRLDQVMPCRGPLWERLLEPVLLAALNTAPAEGSADLAGAVIRETLAKGGAAYRPRIAHPTLAAAFVEPALAYLQARGAEVRLGRRLQALEVADGRVAALRFADGDVPLGPGDAVILALPPQPAQSLLPGLSAPDEHRAIVNAHFVPSAEDLARAAAGPAMLGVLGGTAEWIFAFPDRLSVTVSAADALAELDRDTLAARLWADVAAAHGLYPALPRWQVVKEKRATFAATPAQDARRPPARTALANLHLAGDWTATTLPATIEGALRSGITAAALAR